MRKIVVCFFTILIVVSCAPKQTATGKKPLYEVLTHQENGGGNIHFFEIVSEQKELPMLQGDENLRKKIKPSDIDTSNFIILNMGEKMTGGYSIDVVNVEETADKIIITVRENEPAPGAMVTQAITYPYTVVKINSKKPIEVK